MGGGGKADFAKIYPVGCIYWSFNPINPEEMFGGEWERIEDRFIYAAGTKHAEDTGGFSEITLTAEQSGIQSHRHYVAAVATGNQSANHTHTTSLSDKYFILAPDTTSADSGSQIAGSGYYFPRSTVAGWSHPQSLTTGANSANHTHTVNAHYTDYTSTNATKAHDNMPPYIVAYCWTRVA